MDARGQAFANHEVDALAIDGDADVYATVRSRPDATVLRSQGSVMRLLVLNARSPQLSDVRVRQALAMSLDRRVLASAVCSAVGSPAQTLNSLIFLPGQAGYADHFTSLIDDGAEQARQVLAAAGYDLSGEVATKDGKPLSLRFVIPADSGADASVATLVAQQAGAAGFQITIDSVPFTTFYTDHVNTEARDFDLAYMGITGQAFPIAALEAYFYPLDSPGNLSGTTADDLGAAWAETNAELDPQLRTDDANVIDARLVALFGMVPLFVEPDAWGVTSALRNYGPSQFESVRWQDVGFAG
jgi:peptide/nickel transport system substrate-binding protein